MGASDGFVIIRPGHLELPMDVPGTFGRDAPLAVEIGFGDGRYLVHLAQKEPDWNILGVDVSMGSVWRAYRRLRREGVNNVRLFHGDGRFIVRDVANPGSLRVIYVNFPDPWPRKRHVGNRLLQSDFFELASARLCPGGSISLTTDHEAYFRFSILQADQTGLFEIHELEPEEAALRTKYAEKWQEQKKPIFHVVFNRSAEGKPIPALIHTIEMQHAVLSGRLDSIGAFEKQVQAFEGGHVIVLDAFRALSGDGLMFKVLVEEPDLRQEILIQAWQKPDDVYVGLEPFGDPLGTRGVREAVRTVANWLTSQGLELKESWI